MARDYKGKRLREVQGGPQVLTNVQSTVGNQWFGSTRITSAANNIWFISAGAVQANGFIDFGLAFASVPGSETLPPFMIRSISVGSGFFIGFSNSWGAMVNTYTVNWKIDTRS